jgi:proline dehydrogenase
MNKTSNAILSINPNAEFRINFSEVDDSETITWTNGTTPISVEDIEAKKVVLQSEYDALEYARKRKAEYPTIEELVVALYDTDDKAAIDAKRAEIKLKYPKPGA